MPTVHWRQNRPGLTLVELLLVMGIFAIIFSFATINLLNPQQKSTINSTTTTLISDLKEQQIKAMIGASEGIGSPQSYGIRFETDRYILFRGNYSATEPRNFTINLDSNLVFSSFPPTQEIIFSKRSGEVIDPGNLTIQHIQTNAQKTMVINKLGAIDVN